MSKIKKALIVKCPMCKKDVDWHHNLFKPFCSERCRLMDLGKWADEGYRIEDKQNGDQQEDLDQDA